MITWTIGAGGLLGGAIQRQAENPFPGSPVPWLDPDEAVAALRADLDRFREATADGPWAIAWAAGAATVSSSREQTEPERGVLRRFLTDLRDDPPAAPGLVFLTSSAGGVYAGSANPPFDTATPPVPMSAYGELKLGQEADAAELLAGVCPLVIGRFSNLYGPGQNLGKLQGLISRLALSAATQQPINIFVSLDTLRDYIYVDDAAAIALAWIARDLEEQQPGSHLRLIASGEPVTVSQLIRTTNLVTKRRIPVALGSHPSAASQVLDLRLTPTEMAGEAPALRTLLPVGIKRVFLDILERVQREPVAPTP